MNKLPEQELLCKNCKHSFRTLWSLPIWGSGEEWKCRKAFVAEHYKNDPVKGPTRVAAHYRSCSSERMFSSKDEACGRQGKLWEPKTEKDMFMAIKHSDKWQAR